MKCNDCRWYEGWTGRKRPQGDCRRRAPATVTEGEQAGSDGWPGVYADAFCGEFERTPDLRDRCGMSEAGTGRCVRAAQHEGGHAFETGPGTWDQFGEQPHPRCD